ncbi:MAG: 50S ribosomal protein L23 [Clostridia bacterium]|nr:50S ribosomal protein L23 [Oscillospiraceae bacterium]MBR4867084.1 50S ribosomal protein L23 [Clostridia bacterium]MBR6762371.1 50S ribosomal protein L23 [Clostridia bacterium]
MNKYDIIKKPIITEKSTAGIMERRYTFEVAKEATKIDIKNACEEIFGIKVKSVNTINVKGKEKRMGIHTGFRPDWKKAIVTITEDSKTIEFFDSMM